MMIDEVPENRVPMVGAIADRLDNLASDETCPPITARP